MFQSRGYACRSIGQSYANVLFSLLYVARSSERPDVRSRPSGVGRNRLWRPNRVRCSSSTIYRPLTQTLSANGSLVSHTIMTLPSFTWCRMSLTGRPIIGPFHWMPPTWCCFEIREMPLRSNISQDRCFPPISGDSRPPTRTPQPTQRTPTWSWTLTRTHRTTSASETRCFRSETFLTHSPTCDEK